MANNTILKKLFSVSPYIELLARRIYWNNLEFWQNRSNRPIKSKDDNSSQLDYGAIKKFLRDNGAKDSGVLLVHSAFGPLRGRGKTGDEVVDFLLEIVGPQGTLAMPSMPKFKNAVKKEEYLKPTDNKIIYEYNVQKTKIKTGVLPFLLNKRKNSLRSRHPINTMTALGPLAKYLFDGNLEGDSPLACGVRSSWKRCVDCDALIVGLGTDLTHSLTAIHVVEDVKDQDWPVKDWYIEKQFRIIDGDFITVKTLRERAPKWGALHFAERRLCRDLVCAGILRSTEIDGVLVEAVRAKDLVNFLNAKNHKGYPYFLV